MHKLKQIWNVSNNNQLETFPYRYVYVYRTNFNKEMQKKYVT